MSNPKTIQVKYPDERMVSWLSKNVGPRTHFTRHSVGGEGWCFDIRYDAEGSRWFLTVDDEKFLVLYELIK